MRLNISVVALIFTTITCFGQTKEESKRFSFPKRVTSSDYQKGVLLAKLKPEFRSIVANTGVAKQKSSIPGVTKIKSLASPELVHRNRSFRGPLSATKSKIDLQLYVKVLIDPNQNVEQKINELYATGYFELVEPSYIDKMSFTPNDPSQGGQYYLGLIKAYDAWDITQGDAETVIAIVDSGGDLDHPDLAGNLYTNPDEIANNGIDDDGDLFVDNVRGWDFMGSDTLNLYDSDFIGDNSPQLVQSGNIGTLGHGVWVAGCASASTHNNIGIAGVGFKSKLLFTKHTADNQRPSSPSIYFGYDGILYAAQTLTADNVSKKIINCSWGGSFGSQIAQDIITYVTLDLGCLVVAAAGNDNSSELHYPSAYQYVLSVAATNQTDVRASFSNYGTTIDVAAPGVAISTTGYNDVYSTVQGTSFSCPIVSGAAALVWAKNPDFSPLQVAEQLRISTDNIDSKNQNYVELLGTGRINLKTALTINLPSIRASEPRLLNAQGNAAELGQEAFLYFDFTNYLKNSSNGLSVSTTSTSNWISFADNQISLGVIEEEGTVTNVFNPIKLTLNANTPENTLVTLRLSFTDGAYDDFQFIDFIVNPSYLNIDENKITTSIASKGRLGFDDPTNQDKGVGFVFNDNSILYEMGLLMGTSSANLFNNVRSISGGFDQDFFRVTPIKEIIPGQRSGAEIFGSFSPATLPSLVISYRSLVWKEIPNDKFVILEYKIRNNGASSVDNFRFGIFSDWDISGSGAKDGAAWDESNQIGYIYPKGSTELPHAGIQVLNKPALYRAIDNSQDIPGTPFGLYDGYTDDEKFLSLSEERLEAGTATGNDVSHVVSIDPVSIAAGGEIVVAFALHAANNLEELLESAEAAYALYNFTLQAPQPSVAVVETCYEDNAIITATGASSFKWYKNPTGGTSFFTGSQFTTDELFSDTTYYVSNADNSFESARTPAVVIVKANPTIITSGPPAFCEGQSILLGVAEADEYEWSTNETTQTIEVSEAGVFSVTVRYNDLSCESFSDPVTTAVNLSPISSFTSVAESITNTPVVFTDASTDATEWFWQFGDGQTSIEQNPTHQYATGGDYQITLTVTSANGCQDVVTNPIDIITSTEKELEAAVSVYPNPSKGNIRVEAQGLSSPYFNIQLTNVQGQSVYVAQEEAINGKMSHTIAGNFPAGLYVLKISNEGRSVFKKIIKTD